MILVADVGNTTVAAAVFVGGEIQCTFRLRTNPKGSAKGYELLLRAELMKSGIPAEKLEGSILSSVVPAVDEALSLALQTLTGKVPMQVSQQMETGLEFYKYDGSNLGMDRVADLVAAKHWLGAPVMVFDLGTCSTVTILDEESCILGGMIMPGVELSLDAMSQRASKLPHLRAMEPKSLIGTNTAGCMESGVVIGAAACIDGLSRRVEEQLGRPIPVMVTGGLSPLVVPWCRRAVHHDLQLQFRGLHQLYLRNCG